jgi:bilin biosynthesis protein
MRIRVLQEGNRMARIQNLLLVLAGVALLGAPLAAEPDLDELWRVGSLWQVGDDRERVADARQAIVDAGRPGLEYALTRLHVADTLQVRCLTAVIVGFGEEAIDPLRASIGHSSPAARRNVAELLRRLDARQSAPELLEQAKVEASDGVKLAQLTALSRWEIAEAVPLIIDLSRSDLARVRHRATSLLAPFNEPEAIARVIELLDDETFYVRQGALEALRDGSDNGRETAMTELARHMDRPESEQVPATIRQLLPAVAMQGTSEAAAVLLRALSHPHGGVRGDAADALASWHEEVDKGGELEVRASVNVPLRLRTSLADEYDPFARSTMQSALDRVTRID